MLRSQFLLELRKLFGNNIISFDSRASLNLVMYANVGEDQGLILKSFLKLFYRITIVTEKYWFEKKNIQIY